MYEIREMTFDDIEDVVAIERENFSSPWDANGFFSFLIREGTCFLCAEEDGRIVGYAGMVSAADEADITNVSVKRQSRRRNIATRLLEGLIRAGEEMGVHKFFLEVRKSNKAAISLYEKNGFSAVGDRRGYYKEPVEDALIMAKEV